MGIDTRTPATNVDERVSVRRYWGKGLLRLALVIIGGAETVLVRFDFFSKTTDIEKWVLTPFP